nr:MFS transporter [Kineosporia mesophila]
MWSGLFGPIQVLLAEQAQALAPGHKEAALSLVTGVGAAVSTVLNPIWGAFSDRTTLSRGRRLPWVLGGAAGGVVAMLLLSGAGSILEMTLAWALAQAALNAMLAAITATVPDQVPAGERGGVGGALAVAQTLGVVAGTGIAAAAGSTTAGYLALAGVLVVTTTPYALNPRDRAVGREERPPLALRDFWVSPRRHPDFAWAWITRFLMNLGNALLILYLLYYLKDAVGLSDDEADGTVFALTAAYGLCTVVTAFVSGYWSDRAGRRQVFVIWSGLITAAALLLFALAPTLGPTRPAVWVGAVVLGIGFGAYTAVDFALVTQVLPTADDRARDLGVINIATALPQVLAPVLAAGVLGLGLGYTGLYLLAALVSVLGSVLVVRIRSVV